MTNMMLDFMLEVDLFLWTLQAKHNLQWFTWSIRGLP